MLWLSPGCCFSRGSKRRPCSLPPCPVCHSFGHCVTRCGAIPASPLPAAAWLWVLHRTGREESAVALAPPPPPQATLSLHPLAWRAGWWAGCSCSTCCWQQRQEESRLQRGAVAGSLPLPWQLQGSHGCRQPPPPALASPAKGEAHGVGNGYL